MLRPTILGDCTNKKIDRASTIAALSSCQDNPNCTMPNHVIEPNDEELYLYNLFRRATTVQSITTLILSGKRLDQTRRAVITTFWEVVSRFGLSEATAYCAISIYYRMLECPGICDAVAKTGFSENEEESGELALSLLGFLAMRIATKIEERPDIHFRVVLSSTLAKMFPMITDYVIGKKGMMETAKWEQLCLVELSNQFDSPLATEWLDAILLVGWKLNLWPGKNSTKPRSFRALARYIMALGTIAFSSSHDDTAPKRNTSLIHACAAVSLACRILNSVKSEKGQATTFIHYETWPAEIAELVNVSEESLTDTIRVLSRCLRAVPNKIFQLLDSKESADSYKSDEILGWHGKQFFEGWASISWR